MTKKKKTKKKVKESIKPMWNYCELYKMNFYFHLEWKEDEMIKYTAEHYDHKTEFNCAGKCMFIVKKSGVTGIVIWIKSKKDIAALAHECVHAANWTLEDRGIDIRDSQAETIAFLVEYLMNVALGKIK